VVEPLLPLILLLIGLLVGFFSSLLGLGGGVILVPILILGFGLTTHNAVSTSLVAVLATAASASLEYARQKRIVFRLGLLTIAATIPGAFLGADISQYVSSRMLAAIFSAIVICLGFIMLFGQEPKGGSDHPNTKRLASGHLLSQLASFSLFFCVGLVAGLLGIGGGILVVPIYNVLLGVGIYYAVATSTFTIIFTSLAGLLRHYTLGYLLLEYTLPITIGVLIGAQLGPRLNKMLNTQLLRRIFALAIIGLSIYLLVTKFLLA
jgi:uncharacterized membrane protein YfcA